MSLGLGIFLSALFLGIVALFIATKDRWNWKKIILWPLSIILGLAILGGLIAYIYLKIPSKPKIQEAFWGISLDTDQSDIKFLKGPPSTVYDNGDWKYDVGHGGSYVIRFAEEGEIGTITYYGSDRYYSPTLQKIKKDSNTSEILDLFGEPSHISNSLDDLGRIYSYDGYHVFFHLARDKVISYGIHNPENSKVVFANENFIEK